MLDGLQFVAQFNIFDKITISCIEIDNIVLESINSLLGLFG
mgnify:CR=1 FL=1